MNEENVIEIWRSYPQIGWVLGSSLGNMKTIDHKTVDKNGVERQVKGHELKQYRKPTGYMEAKLTINGKTVNLKVHRVIASCFLPNPLGLPEINHIDCDPTNNAVSNLEWCTHKQNIAYREKYGVSAAEFTEVLRKSLFAVVLKTGEVLHFTSQMETERKTGVAQRNINAVLKGRKQQMGGYWFTENESEITDEKLQSIKDNMRFVGGVIAIAIEKQEPLYFESQHEAGRQLGVDYRSINKVLKGRYKQTHGWWFINADDNAVESTRSKFDDEVANKVEKLMSEKVS